MVLPGVTWLLGWHMLPVCLERGSKGGLTHLEHLGPALPGLGNVLGVALACGGEHAAQGLHKQTFKEGA